MRATGDTQRFAEGEPTIVYCIVPRELAEKLHEPLRRHFRDDPSVRVVVERRAGERRRIARRSADAPPAGRDRRKVQSVEGRRVADRRTPAIPAGTPALPRRARRYADRLRFVEHLEPDDQQARDADSHRLVVRYQAGDAAAVGELYLRYFDDVYTYARVALSDHHEAEDVTQEVFERALGSLARYEIRSGTPFRGWLFRIARNTVVDAVAQQQRVRLEAPDRIDLRRDAARASEPAPLGLDWLTDREVAMFVERLPEAQRQVLVLRFMLELTSEEIAAIMERSPGAVRKLQSRALRVLGEQLEAIGRRSARPRRTTTLGRLRHPRVLVERRFALLGSGRKPE